MPERYAPFTTPRFRQILLGCVEVTSFALLVVAVFTAWLAGDTARFICWFIAALFLPFAGRTVLAVALAGRDRARALRKVTADRPEAAAWAEQPVNLADWRHVPSVTVTAAQYSTYRVALGLDGAMSLAAAEVFARTQIDPRHLNWLHEYAPTGYRDADDIAAALVHGVQPEDLIPVARTLHLSRVPRVTAYLSTREMQMSVADLVRHRDMVGMRLGYRASEEDIVQFGVALVSATSTP